MLVSLPTEKLGLLPFYCLLQYPLNSQDQQALLSLVLALVAVQRGGLEAVALK